MRFLLIGLVIAGFIGSALPISAIQAVHETAHSQEHAAMNDNTRDCCADICLCDALPCMNCHFALSFTVDIAPIFSYETELYHVKQGVFLSREADRIERPPRV